MKNISKLCSILGCVLALSCGSDTDVVSTGGSDTGTGGSDTGTGGSDTDTGGNDSLHLAFAEFDDKMDIYLDGNEVVIETDGLPNHTSPYWGEGEALYSAPVSADWAANATPSTIPGRDQSATMRVPVSPEVSGSPTDTSLGTIGIAISGSALYNDQEGPQALNVGTAAGLDYSGGHIGPSVYHYHTEPQAWSNDDDKLIGVMLDGFFVYGRKCNATGTYPTDLDDSNGHTSATEFSDTDEYHYHIDQELYLDLYYLIFPGRFQGTKGTVE